jgi:hypothetical protein
MDMRTIVIVVAVVWLLLTHGKDLLNLIVAAVAKLWKLAPAPAKPEEVPVTQPDVVPEVEARLVAFATIRPYLAPQEAAEVWAKLEPGRPVPAAPIKAAPPASV